MKNYVLIMCMVFIISCSGSPVDIASTPISKLGKFTDEELIFAWEKTRDENSKTELMRRNIILPGMVKNIVNLVAVKNGDLTTVTQSVKKELVSSFKEKYRNRYLRTISIDRNSTGILLKNYAFDGNSFLDKLERAGRVGTINGYNKACREKLVSNISCEIAESWSDYEKITGRDKLPEKYVLFSKMNIIEGVSSYSISMKHYGRGDEKSDSGDFIFLIMPLNNKIAILENKGTYHNGAVREYINKHKNTLKLLSPIEKEKLMKRFYKTTNNL